MIFGVISDLHNHLWSTFSTVNAAGVNSRLQIIQDEVLRAAAAVKDAGGNLLVVAGDVFHTRGSIDPEVLNPVRETFLSVLEMGVYIKMIPGNHDLKSRDAKALTSAMENLNNLLHSEDIDEEIDCTVYNEPTMTSWREAYFAMVPWRDNYQNLITDIEHLVARNGKAVSKAYLVIHAGIDGVIPGMPDHGLTAAKLASFGFAGVFAGHYHNHKNLGDNVYSIGSLTHQTWGDVGTQAGFLLVDTATNEVTFNATHAPNFIDVSAMSADDLPIEVPGNYVRYRGPHMTQSQIEDLRKELIGLGAQGVTIQVPRTVAAVRGGSSPTGSVATLDQSVTAFVEGRKDIPAGMDAEEIKRRSLAVLNEVRAVSEAE